MSVAPGSLHCFRIAAGFGTGAKHIDEIDHVYPGNFVTDLENTAILNALEACRKICEDPTRNNSFCKEGPGGKQYFHCVDGLGVIPYQESNV